MEPAAPLRKIVSTEIVYQTHKHLYGGHLVTCRQKLKRHTLECGHIEDSKQSNHEHLRTRCNTCHLTLLGEL
jgi:hypothetical protein